VQQGRQVAMVRACANGRAGWLGRQKGGGSMRACTRGGCACVWGNEGWWGRGDSAWVAVARAHARGGWGDKKQQGRWCAGGSGEGTHKEVTGGQGAAGQGRWCVGGSGKGTHKEEGGKVERRGTAGETAHTWEGVCEQGSKAEQGRASLSSSIDQLGQKNV
jgi:hypothetical protein